MLTASFVIAGCYHDEQRGTTSSTQATYPPGVESDPASLGATKGIYPSTGDEACCWLADAASFRVAADPDATTLRLTVFVPDTVPYRPRSESVALLDRNGKPIATRAFGLGAHVVSFPLTKALFAGDAAAVRLRMSESYVPKDAGLNGDIRRLSFVLQSVAAR